MYKVFKYLGSEIQEGGKTEKEINRILATTKRAIVALNSVLWCRDIIITAKKIIYISVIKSILFYGAESRRIRKTNDKKLLITEVDIRRR